MKRMSTIFVMLAAFFWGLSGGIGGMLIEDGWDALVVCFFRGAIGLIFVVVWLILSPYRNGLSCRKLWFWSFIAGVGIAGNFIFYFLSIEEGNLAIATTLMYSAPIFVYIISFILRLENPTLLNLVAISVVMFGILLLTQIYSNGADDITIVGLGTGLLSALSYSVFIFGFKYASNYGSPVSILVIAFTVLSIILILLCDLNQIIAALNTQDWLMFAVLGVFGGGLSFVLYIFGLSYTTATVASIVAMVEPVTSSLFGIIVLNETLASTQIFGMIIILITATLLSLYSNL